MVNLKNKKNIIFDCQKKKSKAKPSWYLKRAIFVAPNQTNVWHFYFSDSSGSRYAMVSRSDHVMYQQMMMAPPATQTVQPADPSVIARLLLYLILNISSSGSKGGGVPGGVQILSFSCSFR